MVYGTMAHGGVDMGRGGEYGEDGEFHSHDNRQLAATRQVAMRSRQWMDSSDPLGTGWLVGFPLDDGPFHGK